MNDENPGPKVRGFHLEEQTLLPPVPIEPHGRWTVKREASVDADVLDPGIAPANDDAVPGGLQLEDLLALFTETISRLSLGSLSVASYDPRLDPDGALTRALVSVIHRGVRLHDDPGGSSAPLDS